jgi:DNA-binding CsgD family transcriptional regulator
VPLGLDRALSGGHFERLALGGLEADALDLLLRANLASPPSRQTVARIHRATGGNLYFALEIGRALDERNQRLGPSDELPIPDSLQELVRERLALLPAAARAAAQVAAALARPTVALVDSALAPGSADAAVAAGVLECGGERLEFVHPLLATVAYQLLSDGERRALHARLAEILDDPEERARHLALATEEADESVAFALEEAARRAAARGAPGAAAELLQAAARLTPAGADDERRRRGIEAAERSFEAGEVARAHELLDAIVAESPHGTRRAHALARLGWVSAHAEGFHAGADVFFAALAEPNDDLRLRIEILTGLAWCLHSTRTVPSAAEHARAALELAETLGDGTVLASALALSAFLDSLGGDGLAFPAIERALALEHSPPWSQVVGRPDWIHALMLAWTGALAAAHEQFDAQYHEALDRGDEHSLPFILFPLARSELLTGDWAAARRHARECLETTVRNGQVGGQQPYALAIEALVEAHLGLVEPARDKIERGLELSERLGVQPAGLELLATRGFLELSLGDAAAADRTLARVAELTAASGLRDAALYRFHGDAIEAKITLGQWAAAERLLAELEQLGAHLGRTWPLAIAARGRGLLHSALGEPVSARSALEQALALCDRLGEPFERARTLLALGSVQRRDRKKRSARESLEAALEVFATLGATLWAERTRGELARVGGRAPVDGLSATEERVAELLASGLTYQQTADALFVSPKTVQWNVSKIYRKLGIRSRAELIKHYEGSD